MATNMITFADLSTYTPEKTMAFYKAVFNWTYYNEYDYYMAYKGNKVVTGLYETPEKFQKINMPHFWMTYIEVASVSEVVAKAESLDGIIEVVDNSSPIGKVALIRDPQGAGFTIYESNLSNTRTENEANTLIWNELHVSDCSKIKPFYEGILNWQFEKTEQNQHKILTQNNDYIADLMEIPNAYKGKYEYWVCTFGVDNLQSTLKKVLEHGGSVVQDEGSRILCMDNSEQAFFYIQQL